MKNILLVLPFLLLLSCGTDKTSATETKKSEKEVQIEYAKHFNLSQKDNLYILEILDPISGSVESTHKISTEKNYDAISLSATVDGMYALLNQQNQLKGIANIDFVYDQKIKTLYNQKKNQSFW